MVIKIKKKKKAKRMRGTSTHGWGARKKHKKSGHHGGAGMSGSGKRADHKKTLITKLYGNKYFGKQGITSKGTRKRKNLVMNLKTIQDNLSSLLKKFGNEKTKELNLKGYKILGEGKLKEKLIIKAKAFTESAKQKIENLDGRWILEKEKKTN